MKYSQGMKEFRCFEMAKLTYQSCMGIKVNRHLKDQLIRSSSSVALNLAEGRARRSKKEQLHFFSIAYGSIQEVKAILDLEGLNHDQAYKNANLTGALIFRLIHAIEYSTNSERTTS